jgi:hypothetical protein
MIIRLESGTAEGVENARRDLETLLSSWGHELEENPLYTPPTSATARDDDKTIDPMALTALVLSIPSAALAVLDLADRINKRRRAKELIDHARQLAAQEVAVYLVGQSTPVELNSLTPDQLLDLLAIEERPS